MDDYQISEKDIEAVMRYLETNDPKNADREYAMQLLEAIHGVAHDIAKDGAVDTDDLEKFLKES